MRRDLKTKFLCPNCKKGPQLRIFELNNSEIHSGAFDCGCGSFYPILNGIPRFLDRTVIPVCISERSLKQFLSKFKAEIPKNWPTSQNEKHQPMAPSSGNFYRFMWERYKSNFDDNDQAEWDRLIGDNLTEVEYRGRAVLDVGGGQGRFVYPLLRGGASEVYCMDYSEAIEDAYKKFQDDERVVCLQGDVYTPPFEACFDFVFCVGVLQHLHDPFNGFRSLVNLAKVGGGIAVWCYGQSTIQEPLTRIRKITTRLPQRVLWLIALMIAGARWLVSKIGAGGEYTGYDYHYYAANSFDHLGTPIINFFSRETIERWVKSLSPPPQSVKVVERFPNRPICLPL